MSLLPYHRTGVGQARPPRHAPASRCGAAAAADPRADATSWPRLFAPTGRRDHASEGEPMNERTARLRQESLDAVPTISAERAVLLTEFYRENLGPLLRRRCMRARAFHHLCEHKTIYLGDGELIVGERGPRPKAVPTYPELTCHSLEDLRILDSRPQDRLPRRRRECLEAYERDGHPLLARPLACATGSSPRCPPEWHEAYDAGVFTEFMEQRAPGHTVLDDKIYAQGDARLQGATSPRHRRARLRARPGGARQARAARGHGHRLRRGDPLRRAPRRAGRASWRRRRADPARRAELERIAEVCRRVPAARPARLPRGAAVLLVLPPRR